MRPSRPRVVVLGAGYAGVRVARDLSRAVRQGFPLEVVVVSDLPHHVDTPALYEVATAYLHQESTLSSETIAATTAVPLDELFAGLPVTVYVRTVRHIQPAARLLVCADGTTISFDILVIALGASLATYSIPGVRDYAFSVKNLHAALELRHHIVRQFIMARSLPRPLQVRQLTFVIVGAGAAGVETAAELKGDIQKLCRKYHIDPALPRITLVEVGPEILAIAPPHLRTYARARLERLGIQVKVARPITAVGPDHVIFSDGSPLTSATTIWTGGLSPHPILTGAGLPIARWGVACAPTLQVMGQANIFAAGDAAILVDYPEKIPGAVPVAYGEGKLVAANILRLLRQQPLQAYRYRTIGALITIGGKSAIAVLPNGRTITGWLPWLIKKVITLRYWAVYLPLTRAISFWRQSLVLHSHND